MTRAWSCRLVLCLLSLQLHPGGKHASAQVVDSLLPPAEELRRFQATLKTQPTQLTHGAASRDLLVRRFAIALERADTTALKNLLVSRDEFGVLYYPTSRYAAPPFFQKPGLVWFRIEAVTNQGLTRLLARDAGRPVQIKRVRCPAAQRQGRIRLWSGCEVLVGPDGEARWRRLFGSVIEFRGRYKLLSYATEY